MNVTSARISKISLIISVAVLAGSIGCTWRAARRHHHHPAPPPHAAVYGKRHGPPPHAPAHGYRAKCHYHYYPELEVYYDPVRGCYFWFETGGWRMGYNLPGAIVVHGHSYVSVELDFSEPYKHHAEIKAKHPGKKKFKDKHKHKG